MTQRRMRLDGITPILSMPFDDDEEIDHEGLRNQVDFLEGTGVRAVGFGFGSEIPKLTEGELFDAMRAVTTYASGRSEVMGTVGGASVVALLKQADLVRDSGVDVLMMRPPTGATSLEMVSGCCAEVARRTGLPLVIQDAPGMTGVQMPPAFLARLVEDVPEIIALKIETPQATRKIGEVAGLLGDEVSILGGSGGVDFVHELRRGGHGTVPFVAWAEMFVRVQSLYQDDRIPEARELFYRYLPLLSLALRSMDVAFFVFKELLRREGILASAKLRSPHEAIDEELLAELDLGLTELSERTPA